MPTPRSFASGGAAPHASTRACRVLPAAALTAPPRTHRPLPLLATALPLLGAALLLPAAISAQTIPSPYRFIETRHEAGAFVSSVDADRGQLGFGPGSGIAIGGYYAIHLGGPFSLEAALTAIPGERNVVEVDAAGSRVLAEADILLTSLDARVKFNLTGHRTWYGLSPYVLAGGGGIIDLAGDQEADLALPLDQRFTFDASFLGTLGTGVQWLPGRRLAFRGDLLLNLWRLNTPPGYAILEDVIGPIDSSQWVRATQITLGAAIRF